MSDDNFTLNTRLEQLERRVNVLTFVAWANTIAILVHALTRLAS